MIGLIPIRTPWFLPAVEALVMHCNENERRSSHQEIIHRSDESHLGLDSRQGDVQLLDTIDRDVIKTVIFNLDCSSAGKERGGGFRNDVTAHGGSGIHTCHHRPADSSIASGRIGCTETVVP